MWEFGFVIRLRGSKLSPLVSFTCMGAQDRGCQAPGSRSVFWNRGYWLTPDEHHHKLVACSTRASRRGRLVGPRSTAWWKNTATGHSATCAHRRRWQTDATPCANRWVGQADTTSSSFPGSVIRATASWRYHTSGTSRTGHSGNSGRSAAFQGSPRGSQFVGGRRSPTASHHAAISARGITWSAVGGSAHGHAWRARSSVRTSAT
jgi:hypothetical protein